jgi:hypothetical protein
MMTTTTITIHLSSQKVVSTPVAMRRVNAPLLSRLLVSFSSCSNCLVIGWPCALAAMHNDATIHARLRSAVDMSALTNVLSQLNKRRRTYADLAT